MITEQKMIQQMKKGLKKRKSIIILICLGIIFQTTIIVWLFFHFKNNITEIITEELQISIVNQQPTLYMRTFHASFTFTMIIGLSIGLGYLIGGLIIFFLKQPQSQIVVSMWERLDKLEQQIQSEHKNDNIKDTD